MLSIHPGGSEGTRTPRVKLSGLTLSPEPDPPVTLSQNQTDKSNGNVLPKLDFSSLTNKYQNDTKRESGLIHLFKNTVKQKEKPHLSGFFCDLVVTDIFGNLQCAIK